MTFSILIANYNNAHFIDECLSSIINQSYQDIEIVIVDDYSTDQSWDLINQYTEKYSFIKAFKNEVNCGAGYTKKRCIDLATGELCAFVDPDDKIDLNAVEIMVQQHQLNPFASLVYSSNYECDSGLNIIRQNGWVKQQPKDVSVIQQTFVGHFATFKTKLYRQSIQMSPSFKRAVDHDLYCCLESVGELVFIDKPLYYYRQHSGGISLHDNRYKAEFWDWIVKFKHAEIRNMNIEQEYADKMSNRLELVGLSGRVIKRAFSVYKWFRKVLYG